MCLKIRQKQQEFLQISQLQKSCCFFMPETAQNNPAHPTEQGGREYSAKKSVWNLCNQTKEKTHVGDILTKTRKIYLHVKQNTSIIK